MEEGVAQVFAEEYLHALAQTPMHECGPWYECMHCRLNGEPVIIQGKKLPTHDPACLIIRARVTLKNQTAREAQVWDWRAEIAAQDHRL